MVDYDLLIASLQQRGYHVDRVIEVPSNAGTAELVIDGKMLSLEEARKLLEVAEPK